jgi:hypothetical protein
MHLLYSLNWEYSRVHVFKYVDRPQLQFQCQISIVIKNASTSVCARPACAEPSGEGDGSGHVNGTNASARRRTQRDTVDSGDARLIEEMARANAYDTMDVSHTLHIVDIEEQDLSQRTPPDRPAVCVSTVSMGVSAAIVVTVLIVVEAVLIARKVQ